MNARATVLAGIVGPGFIGRAHVEALRRLGFVDVRAVAASTDASARHAADSLGIDRSYGSFRALMDDPEIEVVHNCSPNYLHLEVNLAALRAGKHVVSEKPLAMNTRETRELVDRASSAGCAALVTAVNFCYRYYPLVQEMRHMIRSGQLGRIYLVHGCYCQDWLLRDNDYNWRVDPGLGGPARALGDIGSHWCDLVEYITNMRIVRVVADIATAVPRRKKPREVVRTFEAAANDYEEVSVTTEDQAGVLMAFDTGARGVVTVSQVSAGRKNRLQVEINGSERSVAWNQEEPNVLWIGERGKANAVLLKDPSLLSREARGYAHYPGGHNEGYPDIVKNLFLDVYGAIQGVMATGGARGTGPDFPTFADGHRAAVVVEAVIDSARCGSWVAVQPADPEPTRGESRGGGPA